MHFDRYGDVSRIIYANISSLYKSAPEFSLLPEIEEEKSELVGKSSVQSEPKSGPLNHHQEKQELNGKEKEGEEKGKEKEVKQTENLVPDSVEKIPDTNFEEIVAAVSAEYDRKEEEMKDLDRLVSDLLQEASQIPDIPYHARVDGGPFRYCPQDDIVSHQKKNPSFQPPQSSTPKRSESGSRVSELKSSWPNVKIDDLDNYLPKNWNEPKSNLSVPDSGWNKVTVEHEPSPKNWTRIPMNTSRNDDIEMPILKERSSRRDQWESPNRSAGQLTSRDWDVFHQVREKEQELEDWIRSEGRQPRKPVKYSRSYSADNFSEQGSDEWLAKQMAKLQVKRSASIRQTNPFAGRVPEAPTSGTPAWLLELKERNSSMQKASNISTNNVPSPIAKEIPVEVIHTPSSVSSNLSSSRMETMSNHAESIAATPRFPACPPTPYMNKSAARKSESRLQNKAYTNFSPRSAPVTDEDTEDEEEIAKIMFHRRQDDDLKFTVDTSCNWYKPNASREEAISALAHRSPGTFIIRNSNSFPGAYGLAIKVDDFNVRHFLIEPTRAGVRLRGSAIEPVFASLSALVYAHTIQSLALPVKLKLHSEDNLIPTSLSQSTTSKLLSQGAACQLLFLGANNVEMLTGTEAIQRSVSKFITNRPTLVNLRLSKSGLVLTDVMRESFFRNHHALSSIIHAGVDPLNRSITIHGKLCKLFGVVVTNPKHNNVLVLSEYEEGQPAVAIVSFILRVIQWRNL